MYLLVGGVLAILAMTLIKQLGFMKSVGNIAFTMLCYISVFVFIVMTFFKALKKSLSA